MRPARIGETGELSDDSGLGPSQETGIITYQGVPGGDMVDVGVGVELKG
jgi:hypothetical protein